LNLWVQAWVDTVGKRMCVSGTARLSIVIPAKAGIQWPTSHPAEGVLGPGFRRGDELGRFANSIMGCQSRSAANCANVAEQQRTG